MRSIATLIRSGPRSRGLAYIRPLTSVTIKPMTLRPRCHTRPIVVRMNDRRYSRNSGYSSAGDSESEAYGGYSRYSGYYSAGDLDCDAYSGNGNPEAESKQRNWYLPVAEPAWRLGGHPPTLIAGDVPRCDAVKYVLKKFAKECSADRGQMRRIESIARKLKLTMTEKKVDKGRRAPRRVKKQGQMAKSMEEEIRKLKELESDDEGYKCWTEKPVRRLKKKLANRLKKLANNEMGSSSENED